MAISSANDDSGVFVASCHSGGKALYTLASASSDCYFLMGLDPGAERSLRELSILFADVAKFY